MAARSEWVRYGANARRSGLFSVLDRAARPLPAIIVLQEIWGVDPHIEDVAGRFARAGYAVLAPDLYAVDGERPPALGRDRLPELKAVLDELSPSDRNDATARQAAIDRVPEPRRSRVVETFAAVFGPPGVTRLETYVDALHDAVTYLRDARAESKGQPVATVGFCMGGGLSALMACRESSLAGAAIFYGSSPASELAAAGRCPVIGFYGEHDPRINATIAPFADAMRQAGRAYESHIYPGAQHAFFNDTRPSYHVDAARDAFARTLVFLRDALATPR